MATELWRIILNILHRVSKSGPLIFYDIFDNSGPNFIFFHC